MLRCDEVAKTDIAVVNGAVTKGCRVPLPQPPASAERPCASMQFEFVDEAEVSPIARDLAWRDPSTLNGTTFELTVA